MIKTETIVLNGISFLKTYSDCGYKVEREGAKYDEAIDPLDSSRTYTESSEFIDGYNEEADATTEEIVSALEEIL